MLILTAYNAVQFKPGYIMFTLCDCCFPLNFPSGMNQVANIVMDGKSKHHFEKYTGCHIFDITVGYSFISSDCNFKDCIHKTYWTKDLLNLIG